MSAPRFSQYTDDELKIVAALDRELANEIFSLHRQGYDMSEVLHEARWFKEEAEMMKKELQRRKRGKR
ncbi:MAG: hypothetical protein [Bacteriophage sp.]|nr:MAG: hypothetical protein [Bacteriophage sp.]